MSASRRLSPEESSAENDTPAAAALLHSRLLYSPNSAAQVLDVSRSTIYTLMREGRLRFVMIGSDRRIPREELERLAREGTGKPEGDEAPQAHA